MTIKNKIGNFKKEDNDFVLIRMDTLTERLRRMRALNATASNIGITQYTWRSCAVNKRDGLR